MHLFELSVGGNPDLGNEGVLSLLDVADTSLTRELGVLSLKNCGRITGESLQHITRLAPQLESLDLSGTVVDEAAMEHLGKLSRLDRVSYDFARLQSKVIVSILQKCLRLGHDTVRDLMSALIKSYGGARATEGKNGSASVKNGSADSVRSERSKRDARSPTYLCSAVLCSLQP